MKSTGVYWRRVYNLLEGQFEVLVVNAQHLRAVLRRKTDIRANATRVARADPASGSLVRAGARRGKGNPTENRVLATSTNGSARP